MKYNINNIAGITAIVKEPIKNNNSGFRPTIFNWERDMELIMQKMVMGYI
tara:strand:- start:548 stop:697 length:150 start_codon:yes stop_codon:yes gene_type:complete